MTTSAPQRSSALKEIGSAVRHSAVYGLGSILAKALGFLMLPVYTHYLTPGDYGLLELIELSISLLGLVLHMGFAPALLRAYTTAPTPEKRDAAVSTVFLFVAGTGAATYLCGIVAIRPASAMLFGPSVHPKFLLLSFSSFVLSYIAGPFRIYLRAREASGTLVLLDTVSTALVFALNIWFITGLKLGLLGVLLSPLLVNCLWVVLAAAALFRVGLRFNKDQLGQMAQFGLPLIASNMATFVLNFADRFFLQHYRTLEAVGIYAVGYKFGFMINVLLVQPFFIMWQSRMYIIDAVAERETIFRQIFVLYSMLLTYSALGMALLSREIVQIMAGPAFVPAASVIPVIALAYVICGLGSYLQTGMYLAGRTRLIGSISGAAAVISIGLNAGLIRVYGMMGAAWATALSFGVLAAASYWYSRKVCALWLDLRRVSLIVAVAVCLYAPFLWWTAPDLVMDLAAKFLAIAAFPVVLWALGVWSPAETAVIAAGRAKVQALLWRGSASGQLRKETGA